MDRFTALGIRKHKCSRCRKSFDAPGAPHHPGMADLCKECTLFIKKLNDMENTLISQDFSIEKTDAGIAKQIHDILIKENTEISEKNEELVNELTERLIKDEARRVKILEQIKKLQKMKKK